MAASRVAARVLVVDVRAIGEPDLETIETLARLVLEAKRRDRRVRLINAPPGLGELVALAGLSRAIRLTPDGRPADSPGTVDRLQASESRAAEESISPGAPAARTSGRSARCRGRR